MKIPRWLPLFCLLSGAFAQQAPWGRADVPISRRDRVYAADQTSNTVSVIDPSTNKLVGVIRLGDPAPGSLSPLYKGQLLVHGQIGSTRLNSSHANISYAVFCLKK